MLNKVQAYIEEHQLLHHDGRYLVALSGGADSVALLLLMLEMGYYVEAAHCNFHLRGEESDHDEQFVVQLCESRGVVLHRAHFDTREYARLHHVSIEMAARTLRYRYFEQLFQDLQMDGICVAHHRDDSVETLLMNLIRGTGLRGLQGIRPRSQSILRPLLCVSRKDIEQYLQAKGQTFVTDSSNLIDDVVRNKIRLNIIPMLLDINPSAVEHIQQTSEYVSRALEVYDDAIGHQRQQAVVAQTEHRLVLDAECITSEPLLFEILKDYGFNRSQVEDIYERLCCAEDAVGRCFPADDFTLVIDRGQIIVEQNKEPMKVLVIPEEGNYNLGGYESDNDILPLRARPNISVMLFSRPADFMPSKERGLVHLDAALVKFPLKLRTVAEGDWFVPFGMTGRKLISDYLTDRKVNLLDKRKALVVCDATNAVLWLVGYRTDNRFRVSETTERILQIRF